MKKTILIVTKHPESKGGVINYYNHFFKVFNSNEFDLKWFTIGSRPENYQNRSERKLSYIFEFLKDVFSFIILLIKNRNIAIVQVSPSFIPVPLVRDSVYLFIAKIFRKKTITFIRGWSREFEYKVTSKPRYFKYVFNLYKKSDAILVLANKFKHVLVELGFASNKISVTRTMYRQKDIQEERVCASEPLKFVFIGRLSFQKGIIDIIDAVKLLKDKGISVSVDLYGHYADEDIKLATKTKIKTHDLQNQIKINDFIAGVDKYRKLSEADVFLFPTYNEGCPNSIIEALASGLFIISTPVGAIDEMVLNDENGIIIPVKSPIELAKKIQWCVNNINRVREIGQSNATYASVNFEQDVIVTQINKIYQSIV